MKFLGFIEQDLGILGSPKGLGESEIAELEIKFNLVLPLAYKEFLSLFGRDSGNLLKSYLVVESKLAMNRESALDASQDEMSGDRVEVLDSWFFFAQWQGYNFFFFDCAEGNEDPAVYILDDSPSVTKYKDSFTQFVKDEGLTHIGHHH